MRLAADQRLRSLDRELDAGGDVGDFALELDAALRDARDVEQVIEQSSEMQTSKASNCCAASERQTSIRKEVRLCWGMQTEKNGLAAARRSTT